ncbi:MAG: spore coat U domain-containing protein [Acidobacteriota bacterium]
MRRLAILVVLAALGWPAAAAAQCTVSATGVNFGSYNVFNAAATDSTGPVGYRCVLPVSVQITLSPGSSGSFAPRKMVKGAERLNYNFYLDGGRSVIWGDGAAGTSVYSSTVSIFQLSTTINVTVYGRVPPQQDVSAGSFADTVTVTINF